MEILLKTHPLNILIEGSIVKGKIIKLEDNEVTIDLGLKSEGIIPLSEFSRQEEKELKIGQELEVFLDKLENKDGRCLISFDKAKQQKNWEDLLLQCKEGTNIEGKIKSKVRGGLIVNIGVDAFLPSSHIDIQPIKNLDYYIGKKYDFKILKINKDKQNIILSRRDLIEEERLTKRKDILSKIIKGNIYSGIVKNITDYGAFIDIDGLDGLLHITDMSWGRISHPNEVLKLGEKIDVMITEIDYERERVSLGLKQITNNPWENIDQKYKIGSKVIGKVVNVVNYGIFIELEEGVEGLIHITEVSWTKRTNNAQNKTFKIGDEVEAIVLSIQRELKKISLGIKQLNNNPWEKVLINYPIGSIVNGQISNITPYGIFIELKDGVDGMVHISDISWTRKINHPGEVFKIDDNIKAIVLGVDSETKKISLGIKQLTEDPWENINNLFKIGDIVQGKISKITKYGAFVELQNNIDGLVHISQVSSSHVVNIEDILKINENVSARVIKIDKEDRKIGLSIKAANYDEVKLEEEISKYEAIQDELKLTSLGDILDEAAKNINNN